MPTPAVLQSAKTDPATGASVTITLGGAPTAGNVLVADINFSQFGTARTITTPSGWVKLEDVIQTNVRHAKFWYVALPSDPAGWAFTISEGTQPIGGQLYEISGADTTAPIASQHGSTASPSTTSLAGPSLTPNVLNMLALAAVTEDTNQIASFSVSAGFTVDQTSGGASGRGGKSASKNALTSDLVTAIQATWTTVSSADDCIASMVLIGPPAASAPALVDRPRGSQRPFPFLPGSAPQRY